MNDVKQVIVIRKDLKMRRGKEIAQGSHASISFLTRAAQTNRKLSPAENYWVNSNFKKVCLCVDSEDELLELHKTAQKIGLESHLVTDSGLTEFNGVPTNTCIAIGPDYAEIIDQVTGKLKLY